jgi:hypothetical protein
MWHPVMNEFGVHGVDGVWVFVVAVDQYLMAGSHLPTTMYSEAGAKSFVEGWKSVGVPRAQVEMLAGHAATKTVIESRLRRWAGQLRDATLIVLLSGHGAHSSLAAWDTQPEDFSPSSVPIESLLASLQATDAKRVLILFDGHGWDETMLSESFADSSQAVGILAASQDDVDALEAGALKNSLFLHLATEAIAGRATKALTPKGELTGKTLFHMIDDELPRLVRKHFDTSTHQTPKLLGAQNASEPLADYSSRLGGDVGGLLRDPARLLRVAFRTETQTRIKDLSQFRKGFQIPDSPSPSSRKFIAKLASADVKSDIDMTYEAIREAFGYKRKDLDATTGTDGIGQIRTPDFEYTVTAALDTEDPSRVKWTRELSRLSDIGFVRTSGFETVFGKAFDQFLFSFAQPIDLEKLIDRLEDQPIRGLKLSTSSDGDSVDLLLTGFTGRLTVNRFSIIVRGRSGPTTGLLDLFLAFLTHVGPLGEPLMLKGASGA